MLKSCFTIKLKVNSDTTLTKSQKLNVYPLVDGLEQSPFYKVQVKQGIENNTKSLLDRGV